VGNTLTSDVEVRLQDDEEEHEQQEVDDGVDGKLVFMFMRSTGRCRPGICSTPPGRAGAPPPTAPGGAPPPPPPPPPPAVLNGQAAAKHRRGRSEPVEGKGRQVVQTTDGKHGIGHRAHYGRKAWHRAPSAWRESVGQMSVETAVT
jgi:hypothetical protein